MTNLLNVERLSHKRLRRIQAVYVKKIAIIDEYLVDDCSIVTRDHHLDGLLYLIAHEPTTDWRYKQHPLSISGSCLLHKATTTRRRQIVQKYHF